jgi:hypothetical protein
MTPGLCLDSGEFIPASELNRRIEMKPEKITQMQQAGEVWWYSHHQMEVLQKRIVSLEAQNTQLTASLETASSAVIMLKQQQREGWAKLASGQATPAQQPLSVSEVEQILGRWSYEIHGDRARYIVRETEAAHGIKEVKP